MSKKKPDLTPISADEASAPAPAQEHRIIVPAPEPIKWPKHKEEKDADGNWVPFKLKLPPPVVWEYRLGDGSLAGAVARWDRADGKIVLPCVYIEAYGGEQRWAWAGFGDVEGTRPLLGLVELMAKPLATVLLVSGEKTRDAAPKYMPESWVCVTWQGGDKAIKKTDWMPLAGRRVVVWMDKDAPPSDPKTGQPAIDPTTGKPKLPSGEAAGRDLIKILAEVGAGVSMVPVYGPSMAMIPNNGWDLADEVPEGFSPRDWMVKAEKHCIVPAPKADQSVGAPRAEPPVKLVVDNDWDGDDGGRGGDSIDEKAEFRCVGYSQGGHGGPVFHIFSAQSGFIVTLSTKEICSRAGMYSICNSEHFWRAHFDMPRDKFDKFPWAHAGSILMSRCYDAGYFQIDNERGRGVYLDDGRVVAHLGPTLIVDNVPINPAKLNSEFYYPVRPKLLTSRNVAPLTDLEGKLLRTIFRNIAWDNPFYAELMGGWIATAMICGAMPWRTHFWLQGPSGSGKSWIVNNVVAPCFGNIAFQPLGNSSAAGIMASLGRDARPVIFDEAEGKGIHGTARRDMIIEMMRYSSSEGGGNVVKGTSSLSSVSFRVAAQYFLASIGVGISEVADMTRTVVGKLRVRQSNDAGFENLKNLIKGLPKELPERLLRRQMNQVATIRENAETFAQIISLEVGNRRIGDQIGTLMAGDRSLVTSRLITLPDAEQLVRQRFDQKYFSDFSIIKGQVEDAELLDHLASYNVRIINSYGVPLMRSIGELAIRAANKGDDHKLDVEDAEIQLRRLGMSYAEINGEPGFWIATSRTYIAATVMRQSDYAQGWALLLNRHPRAIDSGKTTISFGGYRLRSVWLPFTMIVGEEREPLPAEEITQ